jgi:hypothetical protein
MKDCTCGSHGCSCTPDFTGVRDSVRKPEAGSDSKRGFQNPSTHSRPTGKRQ